MSNKEQTLSIIKPDAVERNLESEIKQMFTDNGFTILKDTPWAHLDIAGMAFSKYGGALNSRGATGFGVRLLNQLIEENYE